MLFRVKKWYWCIYTWFLNACVVQAWRLYRAHHQKQYTLQLEAEEEEDAMWEEDMLNGSFLKATVDEKRRERKQEKKRRRAEVKKLIEMPLLEFTRQVVDMLFVTHTDKEKQGVSMATGRLAQPTLGQVRYDTGRHLIRMTKRRGVCKECHKRTTFRCIRCNVALHPDECFYKFHVPEEEREEPEEEAE